jgi:hypothetical protein
VERSVRVQTGTGNGGFGDAASADAMAAKSGGLGGVGPAGLLPLPVHAAIASVSTTMSVLKAGRIAVKGVLGCSVTIALRCTSGCRKHTVIRLPNFIERP